MERCRSTWLASRQHLRSSATQSRPTPVACPADVEAFLLSSELKSAVLSASSRAREVGIEVPPHFRVDSTDPYYGTVSVPQWTGVFRRALQARARAALSPTAKDSEPAA